LLEQSHYPLGGKHVTEHLEEAGQHPHAPRPVEMQEVSVGQLPAQDTLGERQHEALFHWRSLRSQPGTKREEEKQQNDRYSNDSSAPAAKKATQNVEARNGARDRRANQSRRVFTRLSGLLHLRVPASRDYGRPR